MITVQIEECRTRVHAPSLHCGTVTHASLGRHSRISISRLTDRGVAASGARGADAPDRGGPAPASRGPGGRIAGARIAEGRRMIAGPGRLYRGASLRIAGASLPASLCP